MRMQRALLSFAFVALVGACQDSWLSEPEQPVPDTDKPLFNHVRPPTPAVQIDVNKYQLELVEGQAYEGFYLSEEVGYAQVLFSGGLLYGNGPAALFLYNPIGTPAPAARGTGLPTEIDAVGADHHTTTLLIETTEDTMGPSDPLGFGVVQETFALADAPNDDFILFKYTLTNHSGAPVSGLYAGAIDDPDVGFDFRDDLVAYDVAGGYASVTSTEADTRVATALVLLSHPVSAYTPTGNPNQQPTNPDPLELGEWWYHLESGINTSYDPLFGDIRMMQAAGPLDDVQPGESVVLWLARVAGEDEADVAVNVEAARTVYAGLPAELLAPHPNLPFVDVSVVGGRIDFADPMSTFDVRFAFPLPEHATSVEMLSFAGAPAIATSVDGATVAATFEKAALPAGRRHWLETGDPLIGAAKLTDGTLLFGIDSADVTYDLVMATQLTFDPADDATPTWSPDGESIVFASARDGQYRLWCMDVSEGEASAVPVTAGPVDFAPDWFGSTIVFGRWGEAGFEMWTVDADGDPATELLLASGPRNPRYSPDGQTLAAVIDGQIWLMPMTGNPVQLTDGSSDYEPTWSPDGSEVYYTDLGEGHIYRAHVATGETNQVTPDEADYVDNRHAAVSPAGGWLAFLSQSNRGVEIVLQPLPSGDHVPLRLDPDPGNIAFLWNEWDQNLEFSPDGRKLAFAVGGYPRNDIWMIELPEWVPLHAAIDIKPGSDPNSINLGSNGNVPVAILSTPVFDATTVNPATVTLADAQVKVKGNGTLLANVEDVNGDGTTDLVVHINTAGMSLTDGDIEAVLTGETFDGQAIRGSDLVRVVP